MSNAALFISFNLAEGASVPGFLLAAEALNHEYMSKQKGYISWKQLREGETWVDLLMWESMEDAQRMMEPEEPNPWAEEFYSFIDMESCRVQVFSVEKSYGQS